MMSALPLAGLAALLAAAAPLVAEPVLSEFMASNSSTLADGKGAFPDWIEIHNPDPVNAVMDGWGLRDGQETWLFPAGTTIPGGGYLVVFASGQAADDYRDAAAYVHTTFRLDASGESLALLRPDGTAAFAYDPPPPQREDVSYGLLTAIETFVTPTSPARYQVPDASFPEEWAATGFDDSGWLPGRAAVGYKTTPGPVLGDGSGTHTAYLVEAGTGGNQSYGGALGMDFEVIEEIRVTDLGVFDDNSDGLFRPITAQLWSRAGNSGISILAQETFTPDLPGTLEGGSRFKPLAEPLVLSPGSYTIVAHGYGAGEQNVNQGFAANEGLDIDTGGAVLRFVGDSRYGNPGGFPTTLDGGPANRYGAGTFKFSPNNASDIETNIETVMKGVNASVAVRIPFDVTDPAAIDTLEFEVGVDDGFIAWVNGVEIARHHAPDPLDWDAQATFEENNTLRFPAVLPPGTLVPVGNILAIHGLNISAHDNDFLVAPTLRGISDDRLRARFFSHPTPGAPNDPAGVIGFVADTKFDFDRGFYDAPITVTLSTETPGATIRYTTDGSTPTETHGTLFAKPIDVSTTAVLRAAAFKPGFEPSNVDTQSYLFLEDVAVQGNPPGYPSTWGGVPADYAMDPNPSDYARAAGNPAFTPSQARAAIVTSLRAIPTLSIVTDPGNLFDPTTGIYLNPSGRGAQWERPASVEIIGTEGVGRYQIDAGLRIMGFTSRNLNTTPKLNLRLLFKKEYGDGRMEYPLLGSEGPDEFNTIALRGNVRDAWLAEQGFGAATYIGDEWAKRAQYDMGQPAVRGMFAHVYLNGNYWGLYNPTERPDDAFAETYLGGDRSDYDVVKFCCPDRAIAGTAGTWHDLLHAARAGLGSDATCQRIQGNNPDGSPNPAFPVLIDLDNFIGFLINGHYHAQADWPGNYYVIRDRIPGRTEGFKFFTWDNDMVFSGGNPYGGNKVQTAPGHDWWTDSPGEIDIALRANAEYRLHFADRAYQHYHHGGALTLAANLARWKELAALVRPALFAESVRWGDAKGSALRTVQDHWDARNANMVNHYFPNRQSVVFSQLRAHGLYPGLDAPEFSQHGGIVRSGFTLFFDADATVYYTTDGSDPRLPGGGVNPAAGRSASSRITPESETNSPTSGEALVLTATTLLRARAFDGGEWSALNEATFIVGIPPDSSSLVVSEIMYHPGIGDSAGEFIELLNLSSTDALDLTGVSFSDGITFAFPFGFSLPPGGRTVVVADPLAFAAVHPAVPISGTFTGALDNSGERIALADSLGTEFFAVTYDDHLPWAEAADGGGPSLVLIGPESLPDPNLSANWRGSTTAGGVPGGTDRVPYKGGDLIAYALAGPVRFDVATRSLAVPLQVAADDAEVRPQWSTDLRTWHEDHFLHLGGHPAHWQVLPPAAGQSALFLRAAVRLRDP